MEGSKFFLSRSTSSDSLCERKEPKEDGLSTLLAAKDAQIERLSIALSSMQAEMALLRSEVLRLKENGDGRRLESLKERLRALDGRRIKERTKDKFASLFGSTEKDAATSQELAKGESGLSDMSVNSSGTISQQLLGVDVAWMSSETETLGELLQSMDGHRIKRVGEKIIGLFGSDDVDTTPHLTAEGKIASTQYTEAEALAMLRSSFGVSSRSMTLERFRTTHAIAERARLVAQHNEVQQALNCCQATSIAHALTLMGFPTTVDDIFWLVEVPVESAVGDGMTLSEAFDLATRYIERARLPVQVDCHHFDSFLVSAGQINIASAWAAIVEDENTGLDGALVLNFHSGIAHGWASGGGGHFAVVLGTVRGLRRGQHHVLMADVHPLKYGAYWSSPIAQLFEACVDRDSVGRSRGALRFTRKRQNASPSISLPSDSHLSDLSLPTTLTSWTTPPRCHTRQLLRRFIPADWDDALGSPNMGGMCALALGLNAIRAGPTTMDRLMRALPTAAYTPRSEGPSISLVARKVSYVTHLHNFQSSFAIEAIARKLLRARLIERTSDVKVERVELGGSPESARTVLLASRVNEADTAVLLALDINVALGGNYLNIDQTSEAAKLLHAPRVWVAVASLNPNAAADEPYGVVLCSATASFPQLDCFLDTETN